MISDTPLVVEGRHTGCWTHLNSLTVIVGSVGTLITRGFFSPVLALTLDDCRVGAGMSLVGGLSLPYPRTGGDSDRALSSFLLFSRRRGSSLAGITNPRMKPSSKSLILWASKNERETQLEQEATRGRDGEVKR